MGDGSRMVRLQCYVWQTQVPLQPQVTWPRLQDPDPFCRPAIKSRYAQNYDPPLPSPHPTKNRGTQTPGVCSPKMENLRRLLSVTTTLAFLGKTIQCRTSWGMVSEYHRKQRVLILISQPAALDLTTLFPVTSEERKFATAPSPVEVSTRPCAAKGKEIIHASRQAHRGATLHV